MEKEIDLKKQYVFPEGVRYINHKGKIIVISPYTSNWIILNSQEELDFFKLLSSNNIKNSISQFNGSEDSVINVITQVEARHFESIKTLKNTYSHLHLYLTNACNLRCPHCYMFAGTPLTNELSTEEISNLFMNFSHTGGDRVILTGGEIGLRKDLIDIIRCAKQLQLKVELLTNGTLFSEKLIDEISTLVDRVQISIDGFSEESNAPIRGANNFAKALKTVDRFITHGIKTEIAITPFPSPNLKDNIGRYIDFGKGLKSKYGDKILLKFTTGILDGRDIDTKSINKTEYEEIMEQIISGVYGTDDKTSGFILSARQQVINDNCSYGALNISANGDVYPCAQIYETGRFANIRTDSWDKIMTMANSLKEKSNIINLEPCRDCELLYICGGGCRLDYFKEFVEPNKLLQSDTPPKRTCSPEEKEQFLNLLIDTNTSIFR